MFLAWLVVFLLKMFSLELMISCSLTHRKKKEPLKQTDPPSIPIVELFPSKEYPEGEIQQYKDEWVKSFSKLCLDASIHFVIS